MNLKEFYDRLLSNGIRLPLIRDPKTECPSISYTLVVVSFMYATVAIALNMANVTDNTSSSMELFYAAAALYFGRALSIKGSDYSSDKAADAPKEEEK